MTRGRNVYRVQGFWVKTWAMQKTPWKEFNISCLRIPKDFPSPDFCIPEWKGCLILVIADVMAAKSDGVLIWCDVPWGNTYMTSAKCSDCWTTLHPFTYKNQLILFLSSAFWGPSADVILVWPPSFVGWFGSSSSSSERKLGSETWLDDRVIHVLVPRSMLLAPSFYVFGRLASSTPRLVSLYPRAFHLTVWSSVTLSFLTNLASYHTKIHN